MESLNRYWAGINLDALRDNAAWLQKKSGKELICVIKADAYGHGDYMVATELAKMGIRRFAVSNISEAMGLREKGISSELLIFGTTPPASFHLLTEEHLTQTVYSLAYAKALSEYAVHANTVLKVHVKLDTGMSRMGFRCCEEEDTEELLQVLSLPGLEFEGIYTHFSSADSTEASDMAYTRMQYAAFEKQVLALRKKGFSFPLIHCQNSGGILYHEAPICTACRPGIVLYGITPGDEPFEKDVPLRPLMSLYATVTDVRTLPAGASVSYGRHFVTGRETKVAIVPAGYADGYVRALKGSDVLLSGHRVPIVGNICMDQFMVDVTELPDVRPGDSCVLLGRQGQEEITAEELAERAGTIAYEILCSVSRRVPRRYEKAGSDEEEISYL